MAEKRKSNPNDKQREVIKQTEGPLLVIAGPGSGKTFTLVERIVHILSSGLAEPKNLFIATFTEKAARELKTRISNKLLEEGLSHNVNEMLLGTFHSICLKILEDYREFTRLKRNYTLMDQFDQQYYLYQRIKEFHQIQNVETIIGTFGKTSKWAQAENLLVWVNKLSEEAADVQKMKGADDVAIRAAAECYEKYHQLLEEANALDFSTIQSEAYKLIKNNPSVKEALHKSVKYLMVDEFQDTNTIQDLFLKELTGPHKNICVVGDDDQGLYRFRGASIRNILEFTSQFAAGECKQVQLDTNYRSHPGIVSFYNDWMHDQEWEHDGKKFRFDKNMLPEAKEFPQYASTIKVPAKVDEEWPKVVEQFLNQLRSSGKLSDWNQIAFLFRSVKSDQAVALAHHLEANGIPVHSPRSNLFFERPEVRMMIGALLFMFPQYGAIRKWGDDVSFDIWEYYDQACLLPFAAELKKPENASLLKFCQQRASEHRNLADSTDYTFLGLFYRLLQFPLFARVFDGGGAVKQDERAARNLSILSQLLAKFEYLHHISVLTPKFLNRHITDLFNNYFRFLMDGGISEYEDDSEYAPSGCVSFLTIHQSKGLEFPIVIVDSLNTVPRKQYSDLDQLFDEDYSGKNPFEPIEQTKYYDFKRLFYTAFSRAQNLLVLTCQEENRPKKKRVPTEYFAAHYAKLPTQSAPDFDLSKVQFASVKEINLKQEYSFTSHINLFESCSEQYRFFKHFSFNPVRTGSILFGTLVHETIEDIHKAFLRGEGHIVNPEQIRSWFLRNYGNISKSERVYLANVVIEAAIRQVTGYFERERAHFDRLKAAEVEVSLIKDGYILKGKIDLIRGAGDSVEIIDFKSEVKPDIEAESQRLSQYQRQLEIYAHIVEGRYGLKVSKMHLYYTGEESGSPWVTFERSDAKIANTINDIDKVVARIERRDFSVKERPKNQCRHCDMRFYCDDNWKKAA